MSQSTNDDKKSSTDNQPNSHPDSQQSNDQTGQRLSKPRSPGMFITNDPNKLFELPSAQAALGNRRPLSKNTKPSEDYKIKIEEILNPQANLKRTGSSTMTNRVQCEPKYTVTRTPSNMSLAFQTQPGQIENPPGSTSLDSKQQSKLSVQSIKQPSNAQASQLSINEMRSKLSNIIEITSDRENNIRNYEIEQFRNDENDLKEQFNDLILKMENLQRTLVDLEGRELEEVQQKRQEAENFEKETREKIEQMQVRKEEIDREASRFDNRLKELKSLQRETDANRNMNNKMRNEMSKCLRKLGKQYENGCRKYLKELQDMEIEANERRNRDRDLMNQYKQKECELAVLLEEKMILRKSLEERNQLEKLLGQNGISLLVANHLEKQQENQKHEQQQQQQQEVS